MSYLAYIVFALGVLTYIMVRVYAPWPEKHQNFFWLACFGPMIACYMSPIPPDITNLMVLPFFGAMACCEFLRQKFKPYKKRFLANLHGKQQKPQK